MPNPLFEALSTTAVIASDLHKAFDLHKAPKLPVSAVSLPSPYRQYKVAGVAGPDARASSLLSLPRDPNNF
jgi:hypothetical protein